MHYYYIGKLRISKEQKSEIIVYYIPGSDHCQSIGHGPFLDLRALQNSKTLAVHKLRGVPGYSGAHCIEKSCLCSCIVHHSPGMRWKCERS